MSDADKAARELYLSWLRLNGAGQYEQAVQVADQMLGLEGISPTARQWAEASKQTSALNWQRLRTAEARFQQALAEDPKSAQAWVERGEELLDLGLPLGLDLRYTFLRRGNISPYVRAGFKYIVAGGDWLDAGDPGLFGAAGVEFLRKKRVNFGVEVGYCSAEVEVAGGPSGGPRDVKPCEFLVSIFAIF